jgi:ABC-type Fe3+-siderophore transport system permease subunit
LQVIFVIEPPYNAVCKPTPINTILAGVTPSFLLKLKIKIINGILGGITAALIIFIFSFNKNEGVTPASMVLIGVGL